MEAKLFTLGNPEQFVAAKNDIVKTVASNLESMFESAIAVEVMGTDSNVVRIRFTIPDGSTLSTRSVVIPVELSAGLLNPQA